jgi:hypothetical protein
MARNPTPTTPVLDLSVNDAAISADVHALNALSADAITVIKAYGLQSANPNVLVTEIQGYQQSAVECLFQIGARLLLLRKLLQHGEWIKSLHTLGMNERTAQRIAQATVKYTGDGKQRSDKLLGVGKSKLLELMVLDDDEIDVLDQGGQIGELDLDEVARMSVTELRRALREARMELEAKDSLISTKDQKVNDLDVKLRSARKFKPNPDSEATSLAEQAQLDEVATCVREVEMAFMRLNIVVADVVANCGTDAVKARVVQQVHYLQKRVSECAEENGFSQIAEGATVPWLADAATTGKNGK